MYWGSRDGLWLNMGATDEDFHKLVRRLKVGKPVRNILGRSQATMAQAFEGVVAAIESAADQSKLTAAPVAATPRLQKRVPLFPITIPLDRPIYLRILPERTVAKARNTVLSSV